MLALASMTRPEGPMVAAILGLAWLVIRGAPWLADRGARGGVAASSPVVRAPGRFSAEWMAIAWFLALWLLWFAWRWWYYGWPFPNTYYVKATGRWAAPDLPRQMLENGLYYVRVWLQQTGLLYALPLAVVGLIAARPRTPRFALTVAC